MVPRRGGDRRLRSKRTVVLRSAMPCARARARKSSCSHAPGMAMTTFPRARWLETYATASLTAPSSKGTT
jgi:hypothetical protein